MTALLGKDYLHVLTILDDDLGEVSLTSTSSDINEEGPTEGTMVFEIEVPPGTPKWKFKGDPGMITSPAIGPNGFIYVGSGSGSLYAIHPNGSMQWSFKVGGSIAAAPAIDLDGTVYVGASDGNLYAMDAFGTLKWITPLGAGVQGSSPGIGADGTVYVGSLDHKVYAVGKDGVIKWTFETGGWVTTSPAISTDDAILVTGNDAKLYALDALGQALWTFELGSEGVMTSPAVNNKDLVYLGATWQPKPVDPPPGDGDGGDEPPTGPLHQLICVKEGVQQWAFDAGGMILGQPITDVSGNIFFGAADGKIYALDKTGQLKWEYELRVPPSTSVMFMAKGVLCVGAVGKLFLINAEGELQDEIDVSRTPLAEATVGADGTLYVPSLDGVLHAFKGDAGGLPRKGYARFGGNYQNTGRYGGGVIPGGPEVPTGPVRDVTVRLAVNGTASAITDYEDLGGKVVIPAGTNRVEVSFIPLDDPQLEFTENVQVRIVGVDGGSFISTGAIGRDRVDFVLEDNDSQLEFANMYFDVRENVLGTNAVVTVQRTGPANRILQVDYATAEGTALEGDDFRIGRRHAGLPAGRTREKFRRAHRGQPVGGGGGNRPAPSSPTSLGVGRSRARVRPPCAFGMTTPRSSFPALNLPSPKMARLPLFEVIRIGALDYPGAVSLGTADRGIHDPELDAKIQAKLPDLVKGMFPEDVREWELLYTNHQGDFTRAIITAKPVTDDSAQMRFVLYHEADGDGDGDGDGGW